MKTTFRKIISEIDFSNKKLKSDPNWENLSSIFNIDLDWSDDTRLKSYYIKIHYCTDSYVGIKAYFLDDEFVALSNQVGRKYSEEFDFVSIETAEKVKNYLLTLLEPEEYSVKIDIIDYLDEEIPSTYKIEYNTQILHKKALYNDEYVDIIKTNFQKEGSESPNYFHSVLIKKGNDEIMVDCRDLDFEFNTI
jgi:hypothetical protein